MFKEIDLYRELAMDAEDFEDELFGGDLYGNNLFGSEFQPGSQSNTPYRREQPKVGRNDPCPCGSGKKYKKCCGK